MINIKKNSRFAALVRRAAQYGQQFVIIIKILITSLRRWLPHVSFPNACYNAFLVWTNSLYVTDLLDPDPTK